MQRVQAERTLSEQLEQRTELGHKDHLLRMSLVMGQNIPDGSGAVHEEDDYGAKYVYQPTKKRIQSNNNSGHSRFKSQ